MDKQRLLGLGVILFVLMANRGAATPGKISVLIVEETADRAKPEMRPYLGVLNSTAIKSYLNSHCDKVNNVPEWRQFDKDIDVTNESQKWKDAMKSPRQSTPWIMVMNASGRTVMSGPLPYPEDKVLELLKKYGGP